jgi:hypothetical protein
MWINDVKQATEKDLQLSPSDAAANAVAVRRRLRKAFPVLSQLLTRVITPAGTNWRPAFDAWCDTAALSRLRTLRAELDDLYRMGLAFGEIASLMHDVFGLSPVIVEAEGGTFVFIGNFQEHLINQVGRRDPAA